MGFIRSVGLGIKDFLSAPARSVLQVFNVVKIEACPFFSYWRTKDLVLLFRALLDLLQAWHKALQVFLVAQSML